MARLIALILSLALFTSIMLAQTHKPTKPNGWLPPGESWFEFSHRLVNTGPSAPLIDRYYRGKFIFGWWKPIYRASDWEVDLCMIPYFVYGGFHERRIFLPAFSFRGEIMFRYFLPGKSLEIRFSSLHYSTHLMDKLPVTTPAEATELKRVKIIVDDVNLIRLGLAWSASTKIWQLSSDAGIQPVKLNYWLITEVNRVWQSNSYDWYDRFFYFNLGVSHTLSQYRLSLRYEGEFARTMRSLMELTFSGKLNTNESWADGWQIYLSYEGSHIASNEVTITPYSGIARDWLRLGLRIFN